MALGYSDEFVVANGFGGYDLPDQTEEAQGWRIEPLRSEGWELIAAPEARLIWHAELDPGTLSVEAIPARVDDPDAIDAQDLAPWLAWISDPDGREHAVLSDGHHHIRLDVEAGSLFRGPVILRYRLAGMASAQAKLLPLRRFLEFCVHRRFRRALYPPDPRVARWLLALRVHDGLVEGASLREIAEALYSPDRVAAEWNAASDSMRSRIRRLAVEARKLARGGYRSLLRRGQ